MTAGPEGQERKRIRAKEAERETGDGRRSAGVPAVLAAPVVPAVPAAPGENGTRFSEEQ